MSSEIPQHLAAQAIAWFLQAVGDGCILPLAAARIVYVGGQLKKSSPPIFLPSLLAVYSPRFRRSNAFKRAGESTVTVRPLTVRSFC